MAQDWQIEGPKIIDIGDEHERVSKLVVAIVGGRVDVVTHDDSPTARIEVTEIEGLPLLVRWNGGKLSVTHGKDSDKNVFDMVKRTLETFSRNKVVVSISVPASARTSVSTVSGTALVSGIREQVSANTVSGAVTLSDLVGDLDLNTVSGDVECIEVAGPLKVNTVSGAVTIQSGDLPKVRIHTVSGDIGLDLTSGTSDISSSSVSGDVTVRAPLTGFDVEGSTGSGQVVVDGRKVSRSDHHGKDKGGRIRAGDGALRIRASAVSGNIVVLRAGAAPGAQDGPPPVPDPSPQDAPPGPPTPPAHPQDLPEGWGGGRPEGGSR